MNLELKDTAWQRISAALNLLTGNIGTRNTRSTTIPSLCMSFCYLFTSIQDSSLSSILSHSSCNGRSKVVAKSQTRSVVVVL